VPADWTSRRSAALAFFDLLWGEQVEACRVAVGIGDYPHYDDAGKYRFEDFHEQFPVWPRDRDLLADLVIDSAGSADVFVCPSLSENPVRDSKRRRTLPGRFLWADVDHDAAAMAAETLATVVVHSGSPGHTHVYAELDQDYPSHVVTALNKRLVRLLKADPSPSAVNGYLRPPGTWNHKSDPPTPVVAAPPNATVWTPARLESSWLPGKTSRGYRPTSLSAKPALPNLTPGLAYVLDLDTPVGYRSERAYQLVVMAYQAGMSRYEALEILAGHQPSSDKYGQRLTAEVNRCWRKCEDDPLATDRRARAMVKRRKLTVDRALQIADEF
jgi:hypothetical protein